VTNLAFIARFVAFSTVPFILWLIFNLQYVKLTDALVAWIFTFFDQQLQFPYSHTIYYQTFNLVTFVGLCGTCGVKVIGRHPWKLLSGLACIIALHLVFRIGNVLFTAFSVPFAMRIAEIAALVGEYLVPVVLWIMIQQGERSRARSPQE
jgi:hypothetical protein